MMNPVYTGQPPHLYASLSFSVHIIHHPTHLTSEPKNNSFITPSSEEEWKYKSPQWSQEQIKVLLEAHEKWSKISKEEHKLDIHELWKNIANEVIAIRPSATALTCRLKYNRLMRDRLAADEKTTQDEIIAMVGLTQLKSPQPLSTSFLLDQVDTPPRISLKRKSENTSNNTAPPPKRPKTSLVTREKWNPEDAKKFEEIVNKTDKIGPERWVEISQKMGNKTPEQCKSKWYLLRKISKK
ncbi:MAG: SANT/Myb domain-containing protein [Chlamydiales bacterium]|nr:SANT/Myb domain-containing protein [Chlamydiales bacterium]